MMYLGDKKSTKLFVDFHNQEAKPVMKIKISVLT